MVTIAVLPQSSAGIAEGLHMAKPVAEVMSLLQGQQHQHQHGWFVVQVLAMLPETIDSNNMSMNPMLRDTVGLAACLCCYHCLSLLPTQNYYYL
jgi:hypothetical protein